MKVLLDANVLLRIAQTTSAQHHDAVSSVSNIRNLGHEQVVVPQSLYEFWVVATRPIANNGLAFSPSECDQTIDSFVKVFSLLEDPIGTFSEWRTLVLSKACLGKVAHDARYVSAMSLLGIQHVLTFNTSDFSRFLSIAVIDPAAASKSSFVI